MRHATIRQLQIFSVAATHLSFARTAEQLYLTHAAISLQIKQLEEVAGIDLFDRIGKRVFLTEAGEVLLAHARQVLQSLKDADEDLSALKGLRGGRISVAVVSTAEYFAPGLLAEFRRRHPDIRLRLLIENRETVSRRLLDNEVDLAVMGRPPSGLDAEATPFAPHPLVIAAAASHKLTGKKRIQPKALTGETLIVRESGSGTRAAMHEYFRNHGIEVKVGMELGSNEAIKQAVVADLGIAFISKHTLGLELKTGRVGILDVVDMPVMRQWHLVRHKNKRLTPALGAFWDFVLDFAPNYLEGTL